MIPPATNRLSFRHFEEKDLESVRILNSNPQVMTFFDGIKSPEEIALDFNRYMGYHLQHPGYGYWYTSSKVDQLFVGCFIVKILPETGEAEIGYRLLPEYWGQGLATEGAKALIAYAFECLKVNKVVGIAVPENYASRRVLEKAGLTFRKFGRFYQAHCAYYTLEFDQ